jgi:[NiFe] hydrogenase diaphorase moiety small subunit
MSEEFKFAIDGKECNGHKGQTVTQAAKANGVFIPTLCDFEGIPPGGACRICTVNVNGRPMAACTTQAAAGMQVENNTPALKEARDMLVEMLFVEGNHFCPACEKSGNCELQALAYRFQILSPRFQYLFTPRKVDAKAPKLIIEHNRCIMCKRCVRGIKSADGRAIFSFVERGAKVDININHELAAELTDAQAQEAMDICPVGSIIRKEKGFDVPIGRRTYDSKPIGSDIEKNAVAS